MHLAILPELDVLDEGPSNHAPRGRQPMTLLRKRGLRVTPDTGMKASRTIDGHWVAWIEQDGTPVTGESGQPRLFEGSSRYQAQCRAYQWYCPGATFVEQFRNLVSS